MKKHLYANGNQMKQFSIFVKNKLYLEEMIHNEYNRISLSATPKTLWWMDILIGKIKICKTTYAV